MVYECPRYPRHKQIASLNLREHSRTVTQIEHFFAHLRRESRQRGRCQQEITNVIRLCLQRHSCQGVKQCFRAALTTESCLFKFRRQWLKGQNQSSRPPFQAFGKLLDLFVRWPIADQSCTQFGDFLGSEAQFIKADSEHFAACDHLNQWQAWQCTTGED